MIAKNQIMKPKQLRVSEILGGRKTMSKSTRARHSEVSKKLLPPLLKNWTEGHTQVGVFVRTEMGSVIEYVNDNLDEPGAREELRNLLAPLLDEPEIVTTK